MSYIAAYNYRYIGNIALLFNTGIALVYGMGSILWYGMDSRLLYGMPLVWYRLHTLDNSDMLLPAYRGSAPPNLLSNHALSTMYLHSVALYFCTVFALYLHCICTVFALYLHWIRLKLLSCITTSSSLQTPAWHPCPHDIPSVVESWHGISFSNTYLLSF